MSVRLTVIGLNHIGVSIGLALKNNPSNITRIGSDANVGNEQKALKMDAFDKVVHNIPAAVEEAEMIILCVPMDEVRKNLEIIAPVLKPGAVVLDTSPLAAPVANWAEGILAKERYLISFKPSLNPGHIVSLEDGIDQASADLFKNSMIAISAPSNTHPDAIKLAGDLAAILGAQPYFSDPLETDGLIALTDLLPKLSAAALLQAVAKQPGWREGGKLSGHAFFSATEPIDHLDGEKEPGIAALLNSDNAVRVLGDLIQELRSLQELLKNQDSDELNKSLAEAIEVRRKWWQQRQKSDWEVRVEPPPLPTSGQILGKLFGLGRLRDTKPGKK